MAKYRLCGGLAMTPGREMDMLKQMSAKGWHLSGMKGIFYCFEKGQPQDYEYSLNLEQNMDGDMMMLYESSGWTPIVVNYGYQIFRAKAGNPPIFSDSDSELDILSENRNKAGKSSMILGILLLLCLILGRFSQWNLIISILTAFIAVIFIFYFLPFIGFSISLYKKNK